MAGFRIAAALLALSILPGPVATAETLTIGVSEIPTTIDPHFHHWPANRGFNRHLFDTLVERSDDGTADAPALALSWRAVSETIWEFTLRRDVSFADGAPLSSADVAASLARVPRVPNSPGLYTDYTRTISRVEIIDAHRLRLHTAQPAPLLPNRLASVSIIPARVAESAATADFNTGTAAIGTGPYRLVSFVPNDRVVYQRSPSHFRWNPHFDRVVFVLLRNDGARVAALLSRNVDLINSVPLANAAGLERNQSVGVVSAPTDRIIYLWPNGLARAGIVRAHDGSPLADNPLADPKVRRALSLAIDRDAIVLRVMEGHAQPVGQVGWLGGFGASPDLAPQTRADPAAARQLLEQAGWPDGFRISLLSPTGAYVRDTQIVQAVAQMLQRVNIAVDVDAVPSNVYFGRVRGPTADASMIIRSYGIDSSGDAVTALENVLHSYDAARQLGRLNLSYSNPEVDALTRLALSDMDPSRRAATQRKAMEIAMGETALIPLHRQVAIWAMRRGIAYPPNSDNQTWAFRVRRAD
jgi:peptide/nickel transport system substrate-binding protein